MVASVAQEVCLGLAPDIRLSNLLAPKRTLAAGIHRRLSGGSIDKLRIRN
jgi:hypothetical protein